jgi:hypothetical protein
VPGPSSPWHCFPSPPQLPLPSEPARRAQRSTVPVTCASTPRSSSAAALLSAIRDRGSSIRNASDRTVRVYERRNHAGRWVCIIRSDGSIHDLRGYNLNDQTAVSEDQSQRLRLNPPATSQGQLVLLVPSRCTEPRPPRSRPVA